LRGQPPAQFFLIGDAAIGDEPEDLAMTECLMRVHCLARKLPTVFLYMSLHTPVNMIYEILKTAAPWNGARHGRSESCKIRVTLRMRTGFSAREM
jgi:hypothetical protein